MSDLRQRRQQKLIDCIPDNGTAKTIPELCQDLKDFYTKPDIQVRSIQTQIRRDVYALAALYPDSLLIDGGDLGQARKKSLTVRWKKNSRPLNRIALNTAQMIAFATIKKMGSHLLPKHMEESLSVFIDASENEAISQSALRNPDASDRKNKSIAQKWINKIQSIPERIQFIEPEVNPRVEETVHRALMEEHAIDIKYKTNATWTTVSPLGIAQQGTRTYIVVKSAMRTAVKTLLLARIHDARQSTAHYETPQGFNLNEFLQKGIAFPNTEFHTSEDYGKKIKLELWVDASTQWLKETPISADQKIKPCNSAAPDGDYRLQTNVRMTEGLVWWILSMSYHVKVIGPSNLAARIKHDLKAAANIYTY